MKNIFVAMAKKTQACEADLQIGKIFPLVILLLTGCSPAEPVSSSDDTTKIIIFEKVEKNIKKYLD